MVLSRRDLLRRLCGRDIAGTKDGADDETPRAPFSMEEAGKRIRKKRSARLQALLRKRDEDTP